MPTTEEWAVIQRKLAAPFDPRQVSFRISNRQKNNPKKANIVAYIDARDVADRLDAVVGMGNWSYAVKEIIYEASKVAGMVGTITIFGVAKDGVGKPSATDPIKGCESDMMKRAAVKWGVARYLYDGVRMALDIDEQRSYLTTQELTQLRAKLPRPTGQGAPAPLEPEPDEQFEDNEEPVSVAPQVAAITSEQFAAAVKQLGLDRQQALALLGKPDFSQVNLKDALGILTRKVEQARRDHVDVLTLAPVLRP